MSKLPLNTLFNVLKMLPSNSDGIEALYGLIFYLIRIWGCQTYDLVAGNKFLFH